MGKIKTLEELEIVLKETCEIIDELIKIEKDEDKVTDVIYISESLIYLIEEGKFKAVCLNGDFNFIATGEELVDFYKGQDEAYAGITEECPFMERKGYVLVASRILHNLEISIKKDEAK